MLISTIDLMPTLLTMMGLKEAIPGDIRGKNAGEEILQNRDGNIPFAIYHHTYRSRGFTDGKYTFVVHHEKDDVALPLEAVLFDNEADSFQMDNLAPRNPELVREFCGRLLEMLTECADPFAETVRKFRG